MEQKVLLSPFYIIAAALIGIGDTLFISYYQYFNLTPGCAIGGCETVLTSPYSMFLGIHLSYFGLVYYIYMFALALMLAIDPNSKALHLGMVAYSVLGLLFSIGFESLQIFVIHAICMYCAISAATTLALVCLAIWHYRATRAA